MRHATDSEVRKRLGGSFVGVVRMLSFWAAVVLPAAYPPLLLGGVGDWELAAMLALAGTHLVCLYFGHGHRPNR